MADIYVSWDEYHRLIEKLAVKIDRSGWQFAQIVCLAKGGLRVGDILCRLFRQPLAILYAASYGGKSSNSGRINYFLEFSYDRTQIKESLVISG